MKTKVKTYKRKTIYLLVLLSIFLSIANIVAAASVSSTGEKLRELEETARELRHENQMIEQKIVSTRSLTQLQHKAKDYGFTKRPKMIMLSEDASVAHVVDSRQL